MSAVISRKSSASDVVAAQNRFTMSSGIVISSDIPPDVVNIFVDLKFYEDGVREILTV